MLTVGPAEPGDWWSPGSRGTTEAVLVVHGIVSTNHVIFAQTDADPATTWTSSVQSDDSSSLFLSSCATCAPDFLTVTPASIAFGLTATGTVTNAGGTSISTTTSATVALTRVAACDLAWADLVVLNTMQGPDVFGADQGLRDFMLVGQEFVAHTQQAFSSPTVGKCEMVTPYSLDLFVDANDFGKYGVRNFAVGTPHGECNP
jgi:hypothetical protein